MFIYVAKRVKRNNIDVIEGVKPNTVVYIIECRDDKCYVASNMPIDATLVGRIEDIGTVKISEIRMKAKRVIDEYEKRQSNVQGA